MIWFNGLNDLGAEAAREKVRGIKELFHSIDDQLFTQQNKYLQERNGLLEKGIYKTEQYNTVKDAEYTIQILRTQVRFVYTMLDVGKSHLDEIIDKFYKNKGDN